MPGPSDLRSLKQRLVAGAAVGNITVTGIKPNDLLLGVLAFGLTEGVPNTFSGITDQTAEFTITADNTINNAGGTSTATKLLLVTWIAAATGADKIVTGRAY